MSDVKNQPTGFFQAITAAIAGICTHADELKVYDETNGNGVAVLYCYPHQADYPKLVGAKGRTVNAVKHLFVRAAVNLRTRIAFELEQSFVGRREPRAAFAFNPDFDTTAFENLFRRILSPALPQATAAFHYQGEDIAVTVKTERRDDTQTTVAALCALFYPYGFAQGRMIHVRLAPA